MKFGILGQLEVTADGDTLNVRGAKQSALLAVLLLNANRVVSSDRLIDALWDEGAPDTARKALQVYVSQLRKLLGGGTVVTRPPGYLLQVGQGGLDLDRFEGLVREARGPSLRRPPPSCTKPSPSGVARRLPTSPTIASRGRRSPASRSSDWRRSRNGSRQTWPSAATPSSSASWRPSWLSTRSGSGCAAS